MSCDGEVNLDCIVIVLYLQEVKLSHGKEIDGYYMINAIHSKYPSTTG